MISCSTTPLVILVIVSFTRISPSAVSAQVFSDEPVSAIAVMGISDTSIINASTIDNMRLPVFTLFIYPSLSKIDF